MIFFLMVNSSFHSVPHSSLFSPFSPFSTLSQFSMPTDFSVKDFVQLKLCDCSQRTLSLYRVFKQTSNLTQNHHYDGTKIAGINLEPSENVECPESWSLGDVWRWGAVSNTFLRPCKMQPRCRWVRVQQSCLQWLITPPSWFVFWLPSFFFS